MNTRAHKLFLMLLGVLISNFSIAQTLHVIAFADTKDEAMGEVNARGIEQVVNEFGIAADIIGYDYQVHTGINEKCEKKYLSQIFKSLDTNENDVIVFYYSGHGTRSLEQNDNYPQMCLNSKTISNQNNYISVKAVENILSKLNCRLKILITDCGNSVSNSVTTHDVLDVKLKDRSVKRVQTTSSLGKENLLLEQYSTFSDLSSYNPKHISRSDRMELFQSGDVEYCEEAISESAVKKLLCLPHGTIKITSSDAGQFSFAKSTYGGVFTNSFFYYLAKAQYEEIPANWNDILECVKNDVMEITEQKQAPIYALNISYDLFDELISATDSSLSEYASYINSSDSIEWVLIDPIVTSMKVSDITLVNGEVLDSKQDCDCLSTKCVSLISLYLHKQPTNPTIVRESTFLPDISIRFINGNDFITMSCSTYDDMIRVSKSKDDYVEFEDKLLCSKIIQGALTKFPKDKYLRNLNRKRR